MADVLGIIRRTDDLGRIVIPNEIRKKLNIKPGTKIEIVAYSNGTIKLNVLED